MKKNLILFIFFCQLVAVFAQDKLISIKNDTILVKVQEITPKEIKYKLADNLNGPLITVNRSEYLLIEFENGTSMVVQDAKAAKKRIVYKNSINYDFMGFLTHEVEINYERLLKGNMIGIQIPLRMGWNNKILYPYTAYNNDYSMSYDYYNYFSQNSHLIFSFFTGAFAKFYYNKPAIVRGYSGLEVIVGVLKSNTSISVYDQNISQYSIIDSYNNNKGLLGFMALTGLKITPNPRVTFAIDGGGGYGGLFSKTHQITLNGESYETNNPKKGTGLWRVTTSIGINF